MHKTTWQYDNGDIEEEYSADAYTPGAEEDVPTTVIRRRTVLRCEELPEPEVVEPEPEDAEPEVAPEDAPVAPPA